jgi:hypothetical protein
MEAAWARCPEKPDATRARSWAVSAPKVRCAMIRGCCKRVKGHRTRQRQGARHVKVFRPYEDTLEACTTRGVTVIHFTTRNVAICDNLLVTPLTFITEWYVIGDEISIFFIGAK